MQITALTDIVEGIPLNTPSISFITQIHTNISKINEGDAFFATNNDDLVKAIKKGVFAIILDFESDILDSEIAWIRVKNSSKAIIKLLRFNLINKNITYQHISPIIQNMLRIFKTKESMQTVAILSGDIRNDFETFNQFLDIKIVYSEDLELLKSMSPNVIAIENIKDYKIENLTTHSLFETSFSYKGIYFEKLKIPNLYINDFLYMKELVDYTIDCKKFNNSNIFKSIFINKSNIIVQHGQTNRFILANANNYICDREIEYLQTSYSYAKVTIYDAATSTNKEIYNTIENLDFNGLYIIGKDIQDIYFILEQHNTLPNLF